MRSRSVSVFLPGGDADGVDGTGDEGFDEGEGQTGVGEEGDVVVDGVASDAVAVGELALGVVLGYVYDKIDCVVADYVENRLASLFVGPAYGSGLDAVVVEEGGCADGGIDLVAARVEQTACVEHVDLASGIARAYEHSLDGHVVAYRNHGVEQGLVKVAAKTPDLACR